MLKDCLIFTNVGKCLKKKKKNQTHLWLCCESVVHTGGDTEFNSIYNTTKAYPVTW